MTLRTRLLILIGAFVAATAVTQRAMEPEVVPPRQPLAEFPLQVDGWRGEDAVPFDDEIVATLGVDEYLHRVYSRPDRIPVGLYLGYYQSQRQGDSIHSPLNCLPGAGWEPVASTRITIDRPGGAPPVTVNRFIIQKGLDRQVVLYWYQSHGRVVASEYASKAYLIYDGIRLNRSDAAMIRILSPILPDEPDDSAAGQRVVTFAQEVLPRLEAFLPS